jgi:hypothetical protein
MNSTLGLVDSDASVVVIRTRLATAKQRVLISFIRLEDMEESINVSLMTSAMPTRMTDSVDMTAGCLNWVPTGSVIRMPVGIFSGPQQIQNNHAQSGSTARTTHASGDGV